MELLINMTRRIDNNLIHPIVRLLWNKSLDQALLIKLNDIQS